MSPKVPPENILKPHDSSTIGSWAFEKLVLARPRRAPQNDLRSASIRRLWKEACTTEPAHPRKVRLGMYVNKAERYEDVDLTDTAQRVGPIGTARVEYVGWAK